MTPGAGARWMTFSVVVTLLLAGCGGGAKHNSDGTSPGPSSPPLLHVEATLEVPAAGVVVTTEDRLWVISGGTPIVTQIDPDTNTITRRVTVPHPVAYGTVAHGSLWLVSEGDNAVVELDSESGSILRTLESSPSMPLDDPVGVAVTGRSLWVLNHHDARLLRINERTGTLLHTTRLPGAAAAGPFLVHHQLWTAATAEGDLHQIDTATGKIVGRPVHVPNGLCAWQSVVGRHIWSTSVPFGDFACINGTSRIDTATRRVTPLTTAVGKSLYTFTGYAGRLWATDTHHTLYRVTLPGEILRPAITFDSNDANHLFTAFGSMWVTRSAAGQVLRLAAGG